MFLLFRNYLPLGKGVDFHWTNWNPHHSRMLCAKFGWNWLMGSWGRHFLNLFMYFMVSLLSPLRKRRCPFFEHNLIPITQGCFVPSLVEIGWVALEKKIIKFVNVFSLFLNYLILEKVRFLHFNKLESPLPTDALCQVWLKLAHWLLRRWKCEKFTDRQNDERQRWSEKLIWAFSSGELKMPVHK